MDPIAFADFLASRRSAKPKLQTAPAPSAEVLARAARAARSAPSHSPDFPVRFVKIASREHLADLFEAALPPDAGDEARARARSKAMKGEASIAVIGKKPRAEDSAELARENLMTAGGALTNFLNVLWAEGFGAITLSPRALRDPEGLFDPEAEELLCFILCGKLRAPMDPRPEEPSILSAW